MTPFNREANTLVTTLVLDLMKVTTLVLDLMKVTTLVGDLKL
ncbi:hypothetical protein HMPREF0972_02592 [Actinomyces sp. oral taxon 848 str. F0332]|nr:hypothetical protein HMPREF0972_02592 [Actinomyces sp. oral taxon 848 str. F0332]